MKGNGDNFSEREDYQVTELTYRLFALDRINIVKAIDTFDNLCRLESSKHVFDSEEEQGIIANLKPENKQEILSLQHKYKVQIKIQDKGHNSITVEGCPVNLTQCVAEIAKIFGRKQKEEHEEKMKIMCYKQVHWEYHTGAVFESYPPEINYIIEKAYLRKEKIVTWEEEIGNIELFIDEKKERKNSDPSTDIAVRRTVVNFEEK